MTLFGYFEQGDHFGLICEFSETRLEDHLLLIEKSPEKYSLFLHYRIAKGKHMHRY
jgi:hypothetical protein